MNSILLIRPEHLDKIIKGKKEYPLKPNDTILFNGACWMFIPKDNSILPFGEWRRTSRLVISKKEGMRILNTYKYIQREVNGMMYYKIIAE
mgnify:CR=1 FL=1